MNADYINWFPLKNGEIKNVIFIKESDREDPHMENERSIVDTLVTFGKIENPFARETGTTIYLLLGARISINERLRSEIAERKKHPKD